MKKFFFAVPLLFLLAAGCNQSVTNRSEGQTDQSTKAQQRPQEFQPVKSSEQDETKDWKMYQNDKHGYEIKYPPTWKVEDTSQRDKGKQVIPNPSPFRQEIIYIDPPRSIDQNIPRHYYIEVRVMTSSIGANIPYANDSSGLFDKKAITFAGETAYQYTPNKQGIDTRAYNPGFVTIDILHKGKMYRLSSNFYDLKDVKTAFFTFKFTK